MRNTPDKPPGDTEGTALHGPCTTSLGLNPGGPRAAPADAPGTRSELATLARPRGSGMLRDAAVVAFFALVVVPLAPEVRLGPYGAVEPQALARLIAVLMAISWAGSLAQRMVGVRLGLVMTGFLSGFLSSSATIAAMSLEARAHPHHWRSAASGALASNLATVAQFALVALAVDPSLAAVLAVPLGLAFIVALGSTAALWRLSARRASALPTRDPQFRLWMAFAVAGVVCVVSIASAALEARMGKVGIVLASALAALMDAHATTGSVASLHRAGAVDAHTAELAIVTALSANSVTKIVLAWAGRHAKFGACLTLCVLAIAAAAWLGALLT